MILHNQLIISTNFTDLQQFSSIINQNMMKGKGNKNVYHYCLTIEEVCLRYMLLQIMLCFIDRKF